MNVLKIYFWNIKRKSGFLKFRLLNLLISNGALILMLDTQIIIISHFILNWSKKVVHQNRLCRFLEQFAANCI